MGAQVLVARIGRDRPGSRTFEARDREGCEDRLLTARAKPGVGSFVDLEGAFEQPVQMALQLLPSLPVQREQDPTEMAVGSSIERARLQCLPAVFEEVPKRRFACGALLFLRH